MLLRTEGRHATVSHLKMYINDGFIIIKSSTYPPGFFESLLNLQMRVKNI